MRDEENRSASADEVNLYDYYEVIIRRKKFIIVFSIIPILLSSIFFLNAPEIYKGEIVFQVTRPFRGLTNNKELIEGIGAITNEKNKLIFRDNAEFVRKVKITEFGTSGHKLKVEIETKGNKDMKIYTNSIIRYFNESFLDWKIKEFEETRKGLIKKRSGFSKQLQGISRLLADIRKLRAKMGTMINEHNPAAIMLDPSYFEIRMYEYLEKESALKLELENIDEALKNIDRMSASDVVEALEPYSYSKKANIAKNIAISAIAGIFAAVLLAFLKEYIDKIRNQKT